MRRVGLIGASRGAAGLCAAVGETAAVLVEIALEELEGERKKEKKRVMQYCTSTVSYRERTSYL